MKNLDTLTRTQIYLTQQQQARLTQLSRGSAATKSAVIRKAIDQFLDQQLPISSKDRALQLQSLAGIWANHDDLTDPASYVRQLRQPRFE